MSVTADAVGQAGPPAAAPAIAAQSPLQLFWRRLRRDRLAIASLFFIAFLCLVAIFAGVIVSVTGAPKPNTLDKGSLDQLFGTATGPSSKHWFGVNDLGQDVFSRLLYGLRVSLIVAIVATGISVAIGIVVGLLAGYYRGWVDTVLSRLIDILLAFPILLLAIGLASSCSLGKGCVGGLIKPGLGTVIAVIAFVNWTYIARIVRGQVLSLREKEYVEAARALGAPDRRIIFRHLLPNLVAPLIVYTSLLIPQNILFEAALSFFGVGIQPPNSSLGAAIADATQNFDTEWWALLFPGVTLVLTVLAFNFVGDGLQDAYNPRSARK